MAEILNKDLTEVNLDGSGIFDELMKTVQLRLDEEYKKGRIKGADYSKIYLGALSATMQQALAFLMGKQSADKQADLLVAQTANETLNNTLIQSQIDKLASDKLLVDENTANAAIQGTNLTKTGLMLDVEKTILDQQLIKLVADTALVTKQDAKIVADTLISTQQRVNLIAEASMLAQQELKVVADIDVLAQQELKIAADITLTNAQKLKIDKDALKTVQDTAVGVVQAANIVQDTLVKTAQISKVAQDVLVGQQQVLNLVADATVATQQRLKLIEDTSNAVEQNTVLVNQAAKISEEKDLLAQKIVTEEAQTINLIGEVIAADGNTITTAPGVVGRQKMLYQAQTKGFARDAEQKLLKIMGDNLGIRISGDSGVTPPTGFDNNSMDAVIDTAKTGIGIS